jgi:hypothetical protein
MVTAVPVWAWNNKFKTVAFLIIIYVARKAWVLYHAYVKPFLDVARSLRGGGATDKGVKETPKKELENVFESDDSEYYDEAE